jgi:hypothetical protein
MTSGRHLTATGFAGYVKAAVPVEHPIAGTPRVTLLIDPHRSEIGLRIPSIEAARPIESGLANMAVRNVARSDGRFVEIAIGDPRLFDDAYPVMCAIADRIQLDRLPLAAALAETLHLLGRLLERTTGMTRDVEIGLFGELLLLYGLLSVITPAQAIGGWLGPESEERDFTIADIDVEVKATTGERRAHWISSLTQLTPTPHRPLWLVSYQITAAGAGKGECVTDLVDRIREKVGADPARARFEQALDAVGWSDRFTARTSRFVLRTQPAAFLVDSAFPKLDAALLRTAGANLSAITDVRYRIDVTDLKTCEPPAPIRQALASGGNL